MNSGFCHARRRRPFTFGESKAFCRVRVCMQVRAYFPTCASPPPLSTLLLSRTQVVTQIPNVYERLAKEGIVVNTLTAGLYKRTLTLTGKVEQKVKRGWIESPLSGCASGEVWGVAREYRRLKIQDAKQVC
jgi:hypothetical protein